MSRLKCCGLLLISCLGLQGATLYGSKPFDDATQTPHWVNEKEGGEMGRWGDGETGKQRRTNYFLDTSLEIPTKISLTPPHLDNLLQIADTSIKACPDDVEMLIPLMIEDLPNYANRVIQRSRRLNRTADDSRYVLLAGNPEFEPLTLGPGQYTPKVTTLEEEQPKQVFLTTLERQYIGVKTLDSQSFHWLFLTQTTDGWRLAMMFTQIGSSLSENPPMPPQESSNWIIGQAVSLWLRDCRARAIRAS